MNRITSTRLHRPLLPSTRKDTSRSRLYDSSSSEDEHEHEEEQERLLSEQHGEATEDQPHNNTNINNSNSNSNKRQSDADIANALNSNAPKRKKARVALTAETLTGPRGLIALRHDFQKIKYKHHSNNPQHKHNKHNRNKSSTKRTQIRASATYIQKLMLAYQQFALHLAPGMHYNDTFRKIQDLGTKATVKAYLQSMRQDISHHHLEQVYGRDKAQRYAAELEHGSMGEDAPVSKVVDQDLVRGEDVGGKGVSRRLASLEATNDAGSGNENDAGNVAAGTQDPNLLGDQNHSNEEEEEDENEASFDDIQPLLTQPGTNSASMDVRTFSPTNPLDRNDGDEHDDENDIHEDDDGLEEPKPDDPDDHEERTNDGYTNVNAKQLQEATTSGERSIHRPRTGEEDEDDADADDAGGDVHGSEHPPLDHACSDESLEAGGARLDDCESKKNDPKVDADANAGAGAGAGASKPKDNGDKSKDSQGKLEGEESICPSDCEIREFPQTQDSLSLVFDGTQSQGDGHLLHENTPGQMTQDTAFDNACASTQGSAALDSSQLHTLSQSQDTLVVDSTQDVQTDAILPVQQHAEGSQDY